MTHVKGYTRTEHGHSEHVSDYERGGHLAAAMDDLMGLASEAAGQQLAQPVWRRTMRSPSA